jgi:uncharacterized protein
VRSLRLAASWRIVLALLLASPAIGYPDELTPEKQADIRQLIDVTGGTRLAGQFANAAVQSVTATLKSSRQDVPERVIAVLNRELVTLFEERMNTPGGLIERMVAVYDRHFTHPEVKQLLAFYQTPIGRKTVEVLPAVMSESMAVGQAWGQSLAPEIRQRLAAALKKEGLEMPQRKRDGGNP